jgi:argininosuccinate lyase
MLSHIIVNDAVVQQDKYKYLFSVEKVNQLVLQGMSFRDAYRKVGEMIENGSFQPDFDINHTHEGSIGNLCNDKIIEKMKVLNQFFTEKFEKIKMATEKLKED